MGNSCWTTTEADATAVEQKVVPIVTNVANDVVTALTPALQAMEQRIIQQIVQKVQAVAAPGLPPPVTPGL